MYKVKNKDIYKGHFTSGFSRYIMESVIQGYTEADAYVDQIECPHITVIWNGTHDLFCGGNGDKETLLKALDFIKQDILTPQVRMNTGILKIMYENTLWKDAIIESMEGLNYSVYTRSIYRHKLLQIPDITCKDTNAAIKRIDKEMLYSGNIKNVQGVLEETGHMWGTTEKFLANGFGYCAIKESSIAGFCTSEYLSKASCGIGIETYEPYQRQGIAAAATSKMLNYCKVMGKTPYWDCWKNNIASVKTAEKAGFEKLADYDIVFLKFI